MAKTRVIQDLVLGEFSEVHPLCNAWRGSIRISGELVTLHVEAAGPDKPLDELLAMLREAIPFVESNDSALRNAVADKFLDIYNYERNGRHYSPPWDPAPDLTREELLHDLSLRDIAILDERVVPTGPDVSIDDIIAHMCRAVPFLKKDDPALRQRVVDGLQNGSIFGVFLDVTFDSSFFGDRDPMVRLDRHMRIIDVRYSN